MLQLQHVKISIPEKDIVHDVSLTVKPGEVHAIMGPNGSGKSTLASALMGHPAYIIHEGSSVQLAGEELLDLSPDERAQRGLFLAFQYPIEIPGVRVKQFLRLAHQARFASQPDKQFKTVLAFRRHLDSLVAKLKIKPELLDRNLNEGFSGGEKKQLEIVQMAVLEPAFAILDETDSGLDIDAVRVVAAGVRQVVSDSSTGVIVITHYQRILQYLKPDFVHVMVSGRITQSGGPELAAHIEQHGYNQE